MADTAAWWTRTLAFGVGYYAVARLSGGMIALPDGVAAVWPASALLLGWLLSTPRSEWAAVTAVAAAARLAAALGDTSNPVVAISYAASAIAESYIGALVVRRLLGPRVSLESPRSLLVLILVPVAISAPIEAVLGPAVRALDTGAAESWRLWAAWWVANGLGFVIVTPFCVTLGDGVAAMRVATWGKRAEVIVLVGVSVAASILLFSPPAASAEPLRPLLALATLPFFWAALRVGTYGVAWCILAFALIAAWETAHGSGVFAALPGPMARRILVLQAYLGIVTVGVLLLGSIMMGHRAALAAARASEEKFRQLVDAAPVAMMVVDPDLRALYVNPTLTALVGYRAGEIASVDDWWTLAFPNAEYRARVQQELASHVDDAARAGGPIRPTAADVTCLDGSIRHVELQVAEVGDRQITALVDLTERERANETMRASEAEFRAIFERGALSMALVDLRGYPMKANPALCAWLGYTEDEIRAMRFTQITHADDVWTDLALFRELIKGRRDSYQVDKRYVRKDGQVVWGRLTVSLVRDRNSAPLYAIGMVEDVTERTRLEQQLRQVQKLDALGTLAGGIAHDFNNILGAVVGNLELAAHELPTGHPANEYLDEVSIASRRAIALVRQILTFSRRQEQQRGVMAIAPVLKEVTGLLRAAMPSTIRIDVRIANDIPSVLGDATQVHQLIMNLATNAAHAMDRTGGVLGVTLDTVQVDADMCRQLPDLREGAYVRLVVSDTGSGMAADTLERIFEPFFTTKAAGEGTGLGLAVVHGIVKSHDGAITVRSAAGVGSTFEVFFPAVSDGPPIDAPGAAAVPRGNGERILFVDDEPVLVQIAERALSRLNYLPTGFTRPADALAAVTANPAEYDAVITDLTMPGMTGIELAERLLRIRPDLPILLATGFSGSVTPDIARQRGLRGLLQKPFTPAIMANVLRDMLAPESDVAE